jgi:hypothetical protein
VDNQYNNNNGTNDVPNKDNMDDQNYDNNGTNDVPN